MSASAAAVTPVTARRPPPLAAASTAPAKQLTFAAIGAKAATARSGSGSGSGAGGDHCNRRDFDRDGFIPRISDEVKDEIMSYDSDFMNAISDYEDLFNTINDKIRTSSSNRNFSGYTSQQLSVSYVGNEEKGWANWNNEATTFIRENKMPSITEINNYPPSRTGINIRSILRKYTGEGGYICRFPNSDLEITDPAIGPIHYRIENNRQSADKIRAIESYTAQVRQLIESLNGISRSIDIFLQKWDANFRRQAEIAQEGRNSIGILRENNDAVEGEDESVENDSVVAVNMSRPPVTLQRRTLARSPPAEEASRRLVRQETLSYYTRNPQSRCDGMNVRTSMDDSDPNNIVGIITWERAGDEVVGNPHTGSAATSSADSGGNLPSIVSETWLELDLATMGSRIDFYRELSPPTQQVYIKLSGKTRVLGEAEQQGEEQQQQQQVWLPVENYIYVSPFMNHSTLAEVEVYSGTELTGTVKKNNWLELDAESAARLELKTPVFVEISYSEEYLLPRQHYIARDKAIGVAKLEGGDPPLVVITNFKQEFRGAPEGGEVSLQEVADSIQPTIASGISAAAQTLPAVFNPSFEREVATRRDVAVQRSRGVSFQGGDRLYVNPDKLELVLPIHYYVQSLANYVVSPRPDSINLPNLPAQLRGGGGGAGGGRRRKQTGGELTRENIRVLQGVLRDRANDTDEKKYAAIRNLVINGPLLSSTFRQNPLETTTEPAFSKSSNFTEEEQRVLRSYLTNDFSTLAPSYGLPAQRATPTQAAQNRRVTNAAAAIRGAPPPFPREPPAAEVPSAGAAADPAEAEQQRAAAAAAAEEVERQRAAAAEAERLRAAAAADAAAEAERLRAAAAAADAAAEAERQRAAAEAERQRAAAEAERQRAAADAAAEAEAERLRVAEAPEAAAPAPPAVVVAAPAPAPAPAPPEAAPTPGAEFAILRSLMTKVSFKPFKSLVKGPLFNIPLVKTKPEFENNDPKTKRPFKFPVKLLRVDFDGPTSRVVIRVELQDQTPGAEPFEVGLYDRLTGGYKYYPMPKQLMIPLVLRVDNPAPAAAPAAAAEPAAAQAQAPAQVVAAAAPVVAAAAQAPAQAPVGAGTGLELPPAALVAGAPAAAVVPVVAAAPAPAPAAATTAVVAPAPAPAPAPAAATTAVVAAPAPAPAPAAATTAAAAAPATTAAAAPAPAPAAATTAAAAAPAPAAATTVVAAAPAAPAPAPATATTVVAAAPAPAETVVAAAAAPAPAAAETVVAAAPAIRQPTQPQKDAFQAMLNALGPVPRGIPDPETGVQEVMQQIANNPSGELTVGVLAGALFGIHWRINSPTWYSEHPDDIQKDIELLDNRIIPKVADDDGLLRQAKEYRAALILLAPALAPALPPVLAARAEAGSESELTAPAAAPAPATQAQNDGWDRFTASIQSQEAERQRQRDLRNRRTVEPIPPPAPAAAPAAELEAEPVAAAPVAAAPVAAAPVAASLPPEPMAALPPPVAAAPAPAPAPAPAEPPLARQEEDMDVDDVEMQEPRRIRRLDNPFFAAPDPLTVNSKNQTSSTWVVEDRTKFPPPRTQKNRRGGNRSRKNGLRTTYRKRHSNNGKKNRK